MLQKAVKNYCLGLLGGLALAINQNNSV